MQTLAKISDPDARPTVNAEQWADVPAASAATEAARKTAADNAAARATLGGLASSLWGIIAGATGLGGVTALAYRAISRGRKIAAAAIDFAEKLKPLAQQADPAVAADIIDQAKRDQDRQGIRQPINRMRGKIAMPPKLVFAENAITEKITHADHEPQDPRIIPSTKIERKS